MREVRAVIMGIMFSQCVGDTATGLYMVKNPTVKFSLKWSTKRIKEQQNGWESEDLLSRSLETLKVDKETQKQS